MQATEDLLRLSSAKSLVGVRDFIKAQQNEIDRLKADLQFTKSEAIAVIREKNRRIEQLTKGRKL